MHLIYWFISKTSVIYQILFAFFSPKIQTSFLYLKFTEGMFFFILNKFKE